MHLLRSKLFLYAFFVFIGVALTPSVFGASKYWQATSSLLFTNTSNWTTTAGGACGANASTTAPGASDIAIFQATCDTSSTLNTAVSVAGIQIDSGYTGTISQSTTTITVGTSGYTQADGTFVGSSTANTYNGIFTLSGGVYTATASNTTWTGTSTISGGTFNHNNGTLIITANGGTITPGSTVFNNVTTNITSGSAILNVSSTLTVSGTLTFTAIGQMTSTGTIESWGNIVLTDASWSSGNILLSSSTNQTITATGANADLTNLTINKSGGTVTFATGANTVDMHSITYTTGTVDFSTSTISFILNGGVISPGSLVFNNVYINVTGGSAVFTVSSTLIVNGTTTFNALGTMTGTVDARGNAVLTDTSFSGGTISFASSTNQTVTATTGSVDIPSVSIAKTGGTLTFGTGANTVDLMPNGTWTYTTGTVDMATSTVNVTGSSGVTISASGMTFNNLTLTSSLALTVSSTLTVGGTLTTSGITSLIVNGGQIAAGGNISLAATALSGTATILINGTTTQSLVATTANADILGLTITKTGGTLTLGGTINGAGWTHTTGTVDAATSTVNFLGTITIDASGMTFNNVTFTSSMALTLSSTLNIAGTFTTTGATSMVLNGSTISVAGDVVLGATALSGSATLLFTGGSAQALTGSANADLLSTTVNKSAGTVTFAGTFGPAISMTVASGTLNLSTSTLTITGSTTVSGGTLLGSTATTTFTGGLTITSGTLTAGTGNFDINATTTISGGTFTAPSSTLLSANWVKSGGTFDPNGGTVTLDGTNQSITGSTTFYNLTKAVTTARTLTFEAGSTQTITGTLTLTGASSQLLSLRSSSGSSTWSIDPTAYSITYLDVQDSTNINATAIDCSVLGTCTNSGNNVNWVFFGTPVLSTLSVSNYEKTAGDSGFTLTVTGTFFAPSSVVRLNGTALSTTFASSAQMTAPIATADLASAGTKSITVFTSGAPTEESNTLSFIVDIARTGGGSGGNYTSANTGGYSAPAYVPPPTVQTPVVTQPAPSPTAPTSNGPFLSLPTNSAGGAFVFQKNLKSAQSISDVLMLQKFLNLNGFIVSQTGPGSTGQETSYFGPATKRALIKFQEQYAEQILYPNGLTKGTGYFGPSTRAFVNAR